MDLVLFGIQGSGKGTQAKRLAAEHGYSIFETGAELRKIAASGTELGNTVASYIDHGKLAPIEVVVDVVKTALEDFSLSDRVLFDGFPRNMEQMHAFNTMMRELGREFICMRLTVDEEEAIQRILERAKEQHRADDASEESIRTRMGIFHEHTEPVIDHFAEHGNMIDVNGDGTPDEVYERIEKALSVAV